MTLSVSGAAFKKPITWILIILVIALAGGIAFWLLRDRVQYGSKLDSLLSPTNTTLNQQNGQLSSDQTQQLIDEVGKIIDLPTGETPTVAIITDVLQLQNQEFFKKAQNGDQVLIYTLASKAYLYRPSQKKIIDVQSISINNVTPTPGPNMASPSAIIVTPTLRPTIQATITPTSIPTPTIAP
jgi:hypothetical protein